MKVRLTDGEIRVRIDTDDFARLFGGEAVECNVASEAYAVRLEVSATDAPALAFSSTGISIAVDADVVAGGEDAFERQQWGGGDDPLVTVELDKQRRPGKRTTT